MEKTKQSGNFVNFANTVCFYKRTLAFLCEDKIVLAKLHSWKDLIERLVREGADWLTVLKAALEIYSGDMKGFALLPAAKEQRQTYLKEYMKKLIIDSIQTVVNKYHNDGAASTSSLDLLNYS